MQLGQRQSHDPGLSDADRLGLERPYPHRNTGTGGDHAASDAQRNPVPHRLPVSRSDSHKADRGGFHDHPVG
jgi:hypothetical protein